MEKLCGVEDCNRPHHGHGFCQTHAKRLKLFGDVQADKPVKDREWTRQPRPGRGSEISAYKSAHRRVWRTKGRASKYRCALCGKRAVHWAYDGEDPDERIGHYSGSLLVFSTDPDHYQALCAKCHRREDINRRNDRDEEDW